MSEWIIRYGPLVSPVFITLLTAALPVVAWVHRMQLKNLRLELMAEMRSEFVTENALRAALGEFRDDLLKGEDGVMTRRECKTLLRSINGA